MAGNVDCDTAGFGLFIAQFPRAVAVLDAGLRYRWVSRSWCEMHGRNETEFLGRNHLEVFPPAPLRPDPVQSCLNDRIAVAERTTVLGPDGTKVSLIREARPWMDADGKVAGIIMISERATDPAPAKATAARREQSKAGDQDLDAALAGERERFRLAEQDRAGLEALVDSLDTLVAYVDPRQRFVWVNKAYEAHWGRRREEIVGLRVADLLSPAAYAKVEERIARALQGESRAYEVEVEWRDESYPVMTTYVPHKYSDGTVLGFFVATTDISRVKVAELAQRQALEEADAANRAKSRFLANMSHEIRTPLNAIMGFAELLAREGHLNPVQSDYVQTIVSSGELLLTIINDVLELSRIEAGMVELNPTEFHLRELLEEVQHLFEARVVDRPVALRLKAGVGAAVTLLGDAAKIRQIMINLMSNALKHTVRGSVTLRASTEPDGERPGLRRVRLAVEDTGCGIPADQLEFIFEEFARVSTQPRRVEGTGLGLSLCRTFAQLMQGKISATSEVEVGSTFTLELSLPEIRCGPGAAPAVQQPDPMRPERSELTPWRAAERFERLPKAIRVKVALAAALASTEQLNQRLIGVEELDPPLADLFKSMLQRFDFESILRITGEPDDDSEA